MFLAVGILNLLNFFLAKHAELTANDSQNFLDDMLIHGSSNKTYSMWEIKRNIWNGSLIPYWIGSYGSWSSRPHFAYCNCAGELLCFSFDNASVFFDNASVFSLFAHFNVLKLMSKEFCWEFSFKCNC